jgi:hypothetical protein
MDLTLITQDIAELGFIVLGEVALAIGAVFLMASFFYGAILATVFVIRNQ